jgi:hypothetical protein
MKNQKLTSLVVCSFVLLISIQLAHVLFGEIGTSQTEKKTLVLSRYPDAFWHGPNSIGPFLIMDSIEWEIKRLTNEQLWLEIDYNGMQCWVHFKKLN